MLYADIIVDISHESLDKTYQYKIPEHLEHQVQVGLPVEITFGMGNRRLTGYIVGLSTKPKIEEYRIKEIEGLVDKGIPIESRMIVLAHWMKENFGGTMNDALRTVLSVNILFPYPFPVITQDIVLHILQKRGLVIFFYLLLVFVVLKKHV